MTEIEVLHRRLADENRHLIDEIKGLGKKANETVSDLDSKLNGLNRLKEHEREGFQFEIENIKNEYQYIVAELDQEYKSKTARAEGELGQITMKKEK